MFSVSKTTRELLLKWSSEPVQLSSEVKMPQFLVENVIAESCDESSVMGESLQSFNVNKQSHLESGGSMYVTMG